MRCSWIYWAVAVGVCLGARGRARADVDPDHVDEQFSGQGGRGPYFLSWRDFVPGSERVYLNGFRLYRQQDYLVDYPTGMVALLGRIGPMDAIDIQYLKGAAESNVTGNRASTVSLLERGATHLQATYLFTQPDGKPGPASGVSTVGLGVGTSGRNWKLDSDLLIGTQDERFDRRTGMRFGGQYGMGALQLTGEFAQAGSDLNPTDLSALQAGKQTTSLGLQYRPSDRFRFATHYSDSSDVANKAAGTTDLSGEIELKLVGNASALTDLERVRNGNSQTDSEQLDFKTGSIRGVSLETTVSQKQTIEGDSKAAQTETGISSKLVAAAGPLTLQTDLGRQESAGSSQSTGGVEVDSKGGAVKIQGKVDHETGTGTSKDDLQTQVELNPFKPIKLTAGLTETSEIDGPNQTVPSVHDDQQFGFDFNPGRDLSLSAQLQADTTAGGETDTESVAARLQPFRFLQVSGSLKQYDAPSAPPPDSYDAQVAVTPWKGLKLTGGYAENPESQGAVAPLMRRQVGMETSLGALLLNGGYALEDRTGGVQLRTTDCGVGLKLSRTTQLSATYRLEDGIGGGLGQHSVYGFKFSRDLGDRFSLTLEGDASDKSGDTSGGSQEYTGSAKLGMKF